jgi:hypothetical protein
VNGSFRITNFSKRVAYLLCLRSLAPVNRTCSTIMAKATRFPVNRQAFLFTALLPTRKFSLSTRSMKSRAYPYTFEAEDAWRKIVTMDDGAIIKKVRQVASRGAFGMFSILPVTEIVQATLEVKPAEGAEIWLAAKTAHRRNAVTIGDFDYLVFRKSEHEDIEKLRMQAFDTAKNDTQLAEAVLWALRNEQEDWLLNLIREDLKEPSAGRIARGITLAGLLDSTDKAEALWNQTVNQLALEGWLQDVRMAAYSTYQRNIRARHWFEQYFSTTDPDLAFGRLNLSIDSLDSRWFLWGTEITKSHREHVPHSWLQHLDVRKQDRDAQRKKVSDQQTKTLYFTPIGGSISPWL